MPPVHIASRRHGNRGPQGVPAASNAWRCRICGRDNPRTAGECGTVGCVGKRGAAGTRYDGYSKRQSVWLCRLCMAWHDMKPKECIAPDCSAGRKDMLHCGSRGEAQRFVKLYRDQQYGLIRGLKHHPRYDLAVPTPSGGLKVIGVYEADSCYEESAPPIHADLISAADGRGWRFVVEDFKPADPRALDRAFEWKRKHFEAQYGTSIRLMTP